MDSKQIAKVWIFASSSSDKKYETIRYTNGVTSCACPGWTRRCGPNGERTCKHTRLVEMRLADQEAVSFIEYNRTGKFKKVIQKPTSVWQTLPMDKSEMKQGKKVAVPVAEQEVPRRKFVFD